VRPHCQHCCEVFRASMTANQPLALSALERSIEIIRPGEASRISLLGPAFLADVFAWTFDHACGRLGAEPRHWRRFRRSAASP
jgi:hypothetical protein